jgi:predicted nucleic acid-binding protein
MARPIVIADASALISLGWVDQLQLLPALFGRIVVPAAVAAEATHRGPALPDWVDVRPAAHPLDDRVVAARLGAGETEVLCLGLELEGAWFILDDGRARVLARQLGLRMLGTAAVLVEAKRAGLLARVRPTLDALVANGFRLQRKVYDRILQAAGERSP